MATAGRPRQAALGAMCAGVVLLVVGTFLPWLTSGQVQRNSFAAGAVSIAVLAQPSHGLVRLSRTGPVVTLLGSVLTCAAVAAYFVVQDRTRRRAL